MKKILIIWGMALFIISCDTGKSGNNYDSSLIENTELSNSNDSMFYAVGVYYSRLFNKQGVKIEIPEMARGLKEVLEGNSYMDAATIQSFMSQYQAEKSRNEKRPFSEEAPLIMSLDSLSYSIGAEFGNRMQSSNMEVSQSAFLKGVTDYYKDGASLFDDIQIENQIKNFSSEIEEKQQKINAKLSAENAEIGRKFIAEKAKEAGVKSTPSGLHYKVLKEGSGPNPKASDKVKVHYHGTLIDGTVFDSSVDKGTPIEFSLGGVIRGWTEGLQLMKPNAKFQFYIPADLAYGERGSGPLIGPGATLIFDVELLEIK